MNQDEINQHPTQVQLQPSENKFRVILLSLSFLLALLAILGLGYNQSQIWQLRLAQKQQNILKSEQQLDLKTAILNLTQQVSAQDLKLQELNNGLANVWNKIGSSDQTWLKAEINYLVRAAKLRAEIFHDPSAAAKLLQAAGADLHKLNGEAAANLRGTLNQVEQDLQKLQTPNLADLQEKINQLIVKLAALPLINPELSGPAIKQENNLTWWQKALNKFWSELKSLVIIKHNQNDFSGIVLAADKTALLNTLQLLLTQLKVSAYELNAEAYQDLLAQIKKIIVKYFEVNNQAVLEFQTQLDNLGKINLKIELPNFDALLTAAANLNQTAEATKP